MLRAPKIVLLAACGSAWLSVSAAANDGGIVADANLVTAIDVSGSIKTHDERLELEGMARALIDPRFLEAIARGAHGRIGFAVFTWADGEYVTLVPWSLIGSQEEARQAAERLRAARSSPQMGYERRIPSPKRPWRTGHATDVSAAIEHAVQVSAAAPYASYRSLINICANGVDNVGEGPAAARDRAVEAGLTVNGLVLEDGSDSGDMAAYFRQHVQGGPGSFVIEARAFEDVARAMLAKFVFELVSVPDLRSAPLAAATTGFAGEEVVTAAVPWSRGRATDENRAFRPGSNKHVRWDGQPPISAYLPSSHL